MKSYCTSLLCFYGFVFNSCSMMEQHVFCCHLLQKDTITTTWLQYVNIRATVYAPMEYKRSNCRRCVICTSQFLCGSVLNQLHIVL